MSILLRRPATVPTLFSRALDADLPAPTRAAGWRRIASSVPLGATSVWAAVVLVEVPLVKTAAAIVGLQFHR